MAVSQYNKLIKLSKIAKLAGFSYVTIHKWVTRGVKVGNRQVKMQAVRIGPNWLASHKDLDDFIRDANADNENSERVEQALKQLASFGI